MIVRAAAWTWAARATVRPAAWACTEPILVSSPSKCHNVTKQLPQCSPCAGYQHARQQSTVASANQPSSSTAAAQRKALWNRARKIPSFVDSLEIQVEGGAGGDGTVAFAREKFKPYGPPSGGAGGQGGSIYVRTGEGIASLARLPGQVEGGRGENGVGDWQSGKSGYDKVLEVPVGTIVRVEYVPTSERSPTIERQRTSHDRLVQKYRNAYLKGKRRRGRLPSSLFPKLPEEEVEDAVELRAERDATWRHYAGAVLPSDVPEHSEEDAARSANEEDEAAENEEDDVLEAEYSERGYYYESSESAELEDAAESDEYMDPELAEAQSDILPLGKTFKLSERRFAFWLIAQRIREAAVRAQELERSKAELLETQEEEERDDTDGTPPSWTVDLSEHTDTPLLVARGGHGGLGNAFFASSQTRTPTSATRGSAGDRIILHLEWKIKGDIGLIGMPNAGKSTFLKSVCAAGDSVRVAGYAFTTLKPNLGIVRIGERGTLLGAGHDDVVESAPVANVVDGSRADAGREADEFLAAAKRRAQRRAAADALPEDEAFRFTMQDLPGLVEGAAVNRGLGHDFLKHVERCKALYYVVDMSTPEGAGITGNDVRSEPWVDMELVHAELEGYSAGLSKKVQGVLANKCDILDESDQGRAALSRLAQEAKRLHGGRTIPVFPMSARKRLGVQDAVHAMARVVDEARQAEAREAAEEAEEAEL